MKSLLIAVVFVVSLKCSAQEIKFKNTYSKLPFQLTVKSSIDSVYNRLLYFINENGYKIHNQSKDNGSMITDRFNARWTYEKKSVLNDSTAIIVVPMYHNKNNNTIYPVPKWNGILSAELNLEIQQKDDSVLISFNIVNVQHAVYNSKDGNTQYVPFNNFNSTGYLEKKLTSLF